MRTTFPAPLAADSSAEVATENRTVEADDRGWQDTTPKPWRRFIARVIDTFFLSTVVYVILAVALAALAPSVYERVFLSKPNIGDAVTDSMASLLLVLPLEALLIGLTDMTPGKWLTGVRVTALDWRPIGVASALQREVSVLLRGLALGIPIASPLAMAFAHARLKKHGSTLWDENQPWIVSHRPNGAKQAVLFAMAAIFFLCIAVADRMYMQELPRNELSQVLSVGPSSAKSIIGITTPSIGSIRSSCVRPTIRLSRTRRQLLKETSRPMIDLLGQNPSRRATNNGRLP